MGQIDFDLPVRSGEREFARRLLRYAQGIARDRRCERPTQLQYRWNGRSDGAEFDHYVVVIDGDFAELQALGAELSAVIQHYGTGIRSADASLRRSVLPEVFAAALFRAVVERSADFIRITRSVVSLGGFVQVNSYVFALTGRDHIDRTLGAATQALIHWRNDRLAPSVLLEQLHTAVELVLKTVLHAPNRNATFAQLVAAVCAASLISPDESLALLRLKDMRRDGKHRGQHLSQSRLEEVLTEAVSVLQRLAVYLAPEEDPVEVVD